MSSSFGASGRGRHAGGGPRAGGVSCLDDVLNPLNAPAAEGFHDFDRMTPSVDLE
jgi:hypothetical protein